MKMTYYDILRRPIITEKSSYQASDLNQVAFEVDSKATKTMIKEAVEAVFDVTVERVNVMNMPAKKKMAGASRRLVSRRRAYKKAIITLAPGDSIEVFEGVQ
jgi:large subunit ribosomal protein L23